MLVLWCLFAVTTFNTAWMENLTVAVKLRNAFDNYCLIAVNNYLLNWMQHLWCGGVRYRNRYPFNFLSSARLQCISIILLFLAKICWLLCYSWSTRRKLISIVTHIRYIYGNISIIYLWRIRPKLVAIWHVATSEKINVSEVAETNLPCDAKRSPQVYADRTQLAPYISVVCCTGK